MEKSLTGLLTASTLAIGTEVTDGQITDRNSAWISDCLVQVGINVREHRAVPDDRALILQTLKELSASCDLLFVTGGLGPTSDDFTREVIASFTGESLEFSESSWAEVNRKLSSRGVGVAPSQKNQCYFPKNSSVLANPIGTADGFLVHFRKCEIYVLPGPPKEIEAIWKSCVAARIDSRVPAHLRERLFIFRCLGKAESDLADLVEAEVAQEVARGGLRVGYRAHLPYVEVKIWLRQEDLQVKQVVLDRVEKSISTWLINRDDEDVAQDFCQLIARFEKVDLYDFTTRGYFTERLGSFVESQFTNLNFSVHTAWSDENIFVPSQDEKHLQLFIKTNADKLAWSIELKLGSYQDQQTVLPPYKYDLRAERARKFVTELSLLRFKKMLTEVLSLP